MVPEIRINATEEQLRYIEEGNIDYKVLDSEEVKYLDIISALKTRIEDIDWAGENKDLPYVVDNHDIRNIFLKNNTLNKIETLADILSWGDYSQVVNTFRISVIARNAIEKSLERRGLYFGMDVPEYLSKYSKK